MLFFERVKSKVIISLFETVKLSVSISPRDLYNSLKSIKEIIYQYKFIQPMLNRTCVSERDSKCRSVDFNKYVALDV